MRSFRYGCFAEPTLLAFHDLPSSLLSLPSLQHAQCSLSGSVITHAGVWDVKHVVGIAVEDNKAPICDVSQTLLSDAAPRAWSCAC
jgi:hypothetical protein